MQAACAPSTSPTRISSYSASVWATIASAWQVWSTDYGLRFLSDHIAFFDQLLLLEFASSLMHCHLVAFCAHCNILNKRGKGKTYAFSLFSPPEIKKKQMLKAFVVVVVVVV